MSTNFQITRLAECIPSVILTPREQVMPALRQLRLRHPDRPCACHFDASVLPREHIRDARPLKVPAGADRKIRSVPRRFTFLPFEVPERLDLIEPCELRRAAASQPDFPDASRALRVWRVGAHADRDRDRTLNVEDIRRLPRAAVVSLKVDDPQFVEHLAHHPAHAQETGTAQVRRRSDERHDAAVLR